MTKDEFLSSLSRALSTAGDQNLVVKNMDFYRSYIDGETAKGRSEDEVLEELGDPRLIANSIKEAQGLDEDFAYEASTFYTGENYEYEYAGEEGEKQKKTWYSKEKEKPRGGWTDFHIDRTGTDAQEFYEETFFSEPEPDINHTRYQNNDIKLEAEAMVEKTYIILGVIAFVVLAIVIAVIVLFTKLVILLLPIWLPLLIIFTVYNAIKHLSK